MKSVAPMRRVGMVIISMLSLCILFSKVGDTEAQVLDSRWIQPQRLSSPGLSGISGSAEAAMVADKYGLVHVFWVETNPNDNLDAIIYSYFDGFDWSPPVDIWLVRRGRSVGFLSPAVDDDGQLHLVWTEGNEGPLYYASAPAYDAASAKSWSNPLEFSFPAYRPRLQVDANGTLHLVYANFYGIEPGIYYTRSFDDGMNWEPPRWLDPDIPMDVVPQSVLLELDGQGGLHVVWYYILPDSAGVLSHSVRYSHSLDGGANWSSPFTIDEADESEDELRLPHPGMAVVGDSVHVIWAGNSDVRREHRYSLDRGITWGTTEEVFGRLQGMALGDGLAVDNSGRLYLLSQIRWPQGIYSMQWTRENGWTDPSMIYAIAYGDAEGRQGRYHAHSLRSVIRADRQLILTFTDEAGGPLYVTYRDMERLAPQSLAPTPTATLPPTADIEVTPTVFADSFEQQEPENEEILSDVVEDPPSIGRPIWIGVVPALFFVGVFVVIRSYWIRK